MLRIAELSAISGCDSCVVTHFSMAIAVGALCKPDIAQQALKSMPELISRDPTAYLRRHGTTDEIVHALLKGLEKAKQIASSN